MLPKNLIFLILSAVACAGSPAPSSAPAPVPATTDVVRNGRIETISVPAPSLKDNLLGEPGERVVSVYLPPSYDRAPDRRYPVLYLLHGIFDTNETWLKGWHDPSRGFSKLDELLDKGIAAGHIKELIVVAPNARTKFSGAFYRNSPVKGNWEDFIVKDLVGHVDENYRTLAAAASRGVAGHSMGGHGAIILGMKYPETFSVLYGLNPALLDWSGDTTAENPAFLEATRLERIEDLDPQDFWVVAIIGVSQAFSPNVDAPPFFVDLPFGEVDGKLSPMQPGHDGWTAHMPVYMARKYVANLERLRSIRFDSAFKDEFTHIPSGSRALSEVLDELGIEHTFEMYNGDHRNRLWGQHGRLYREVLPYFSAHLTR